TSGSPRLPRRNPTRWFARRRLQRRIQASFDKAVPPLAVPRVSVIMPAYNADATIVEAVSSALEQTVGHIEVIVVDDGSRPAAAKALASIKDGRLRIFRRDVNEGVARARNLGIGAARGPL